VCVVVLLLAEVRWELLRAGCWFVSVTVVPDMSVLLTVLGTAGAPAWAWPELLHML
jgi:hypothetical protein